MKRKKIIITITLICSFIIAICFSISKHNLNINKISNTDNPITDSKVSNIYTEVYDYEQYKDLPIYYNDATFQYDTSTPEKAIGVADYVFIARVDSILRTEYRFPVEVIVEGVEKIIYDPFTVYSMTVIQNIKGEITEKRNIEIVQYGGLNEDKKSYSFMEEMGLLNVGEYYILLPCASPENGELRIEQESSVISLGILNENEVQTVKSKETIQTITAISSEDIDEEEKPYTSSIDIVSKYIQASENAIVPEGKKLTKSKLYDKDVKE